MWSALADIPSLYGNWHYEYVTSLWVANKKIMLANVVNAAAMWCLQKLRNKICFQGPVRDEDCTDLDLKNFKKVETNTQCGDGGRVGIDHPKDRARREPTTWNQLESIKFSRIGVVSALGEDYIVVIQQSFEFVLQSNTVCDFWPLGLALAGGPYTSAL